MSRSTGKQTKYDAFISYSRHDDEIFVRNMAAVLATKGFEVWLDRTQMPNRGETFLREIQRAIDDSDRVIAVIGPEAIASPYVRTEWDYAQLVCKVVVPILRVGHSRDLIPSRIRRDDFALVPSELRSFHCPDFRPNRDQAEAFAELERILREPVIEPAPAYFAPSLPPHFLLRSDVLDRVGKALLADAFQPSTIEHASKRTAVIRGAAGLGKSVIAASIARSVAIRRSFDDGVIWLRLGPEPDLRSQLGMLRRALTGQTQPATAEHLIAELPECLHDKRCLIVLDDVWNVEHVQPFWNALGVRCRLLITTRDAAISTSLNAEECELGLLQHEDAVTLLAQWAEVPTDGLHKAAHELIRRCGHLPLALALCGALLRDKTPLTDLLAALEAADLSFISHDLLNYEHPHVFRAMQFSVEVLARQRPEVPSRYAELAVFWPERRVPEKVVLTVWCRDGVMSPRDARRILAELDRKSLLRLEGEAAERTVWLHDLAWGYVRAAAREMPGLDDVLLTAYSAKCREGWHSGPNDGYFFEHLVRHLLRAGRVDSALALAEDFAWLTKQLEATDIYQVISDVERLGPAMSRWLTFFERNSHRLRRNELKPAVHLLQLATAIPAGDPIRRRAEDYVSAGSSPEYWVRSRTDRMTGRPDWVRVFEGAFEPQETLAFTPGGERIVSASAYLMVWETMTGKLLHRHFVSEDRFPRAVAVHPDGRRAFTGDLGGTISVWDLESGHSYPMSEPGPSINAIAVHPNGGALIIGDDQGRIRRWNIAGAPAGETIASHFGGSVRSILFDLDGKRVISASWDGTAMVTNLGREGRSYRFDDHGSRVNAAAFHPNGTHAVSAGEDDTIKIWEIVTSRCTATIAGHGHMATTLAIHPDGRRIITGGVDRDVCVWDLSGLALIKRFSGHHAYLNAIALHPQGRWVASAAEDKTVRLWDLETSLQVERESHRASVEVLAIHPGGHLVASADRNGDVSLWDVGVGACVMRCESDLDQALTIAFLADGSLVAGGVRREKKAALRLWSPNGYHRQPVDAIIEEIRVVRKIVAHSDGKRAVILGHGGVLGNGSLAIWDTATRECSRIIPIGSGSIFVIHRDGRRVIIGDDYDNILRIWDIDSGELVCSMVGHSRGVNGLALHPDGRRLISASRDHTLIEWDIDNGRRLRVFREEHVMPMQTITIHPGGNFAISGSMSSSVAVWDLESGERIRQLGSWSQGQGSINHVLVTDDGRLTVTADARGYVRIWEAQTGKWLGTWSADAPIKSLAFASGVIIAGTEGGEVLLLELVEGVTGRR